MSKLARISAILIAVFLLIAPTGCNKLKESAGKQKQLTKLQPGMNYLQPIKWRLTYHYRVQSILPDFPIVGRRQSAYNPSVPAIGKGTYEVWMVPPLEGESVRNVELVYSSIAPTEITQTESGDTTMYYFDFAPDGYLPCEISAIVTWEFITFERYAYWEGMEWGEYDKESELYKRYTAIEAPISVNKSLTDTASYLKKSHPDNPWRFGLECYNEILRTFYYDIEQAWWLGYSGQAALHPADIAWDNKAGICDEFASVFCALMRSQGIPTRPIAGYSHTTPLINPIDPSQNEIAMQYSLDAAQSKYGPLLDFGCHAWAEFYVQDVGWIPVDPTWGWYPQPVGKFMSYMGNKREIPIVDYYFGKMDPYRIAISKEWNIELNPPPKAPGVDPIDTFIIAATERASGIKRIHRGWTAGAGQTAFADEKINTTKRTGIVEDYKGTNVDIELQCLGPIDINEIPDVLAEIEAENGHYIKVPPLPGDYPFYTYGFAVQDQMIERWAKITGIDIEDVILP